MKIKASNSEKVISKLLTSGLIINLVVLLLVLGAVFAEKDRIRGYFSGTANHGSLISAGSALRHLISAFLIIFAGGYFLVYQRFNLKKNRPQLGFAVSSFLSSLTSGSIFSLGFVLILGILDKVNFGPNLFNLVYCSIFAFLLSFSTKIDGFYELVMGSNKDTNSPKRKLVVSSWVHIQDFLVLFVLLTTLIVLYVIGPQDLFFELALVAVIVLSYLSGIIVPFQFLKFR
ncbi:MAG: hypothetical protein ABIE03_00675 [Patescibacteria group bacterium]|nr:hypothetical protein [Patescibacteria group bacterium]